MLFSRDTEHSLACAVDLVNSAPVDGADEGLPDLAALHDFVHRHDVSEVGRLTTADLRGVRRLRDAVRPVFTTEDVRIGGHGRQPPRLPGRGDAAAHRPRRLRLAHPLLHPRRLARRPPRHRLRDGAGAGHRLRRDRASPGLARPPTATRSSSTSPATAPSATATPAPAATGSTSRPTVSASAPPTERPAVTGRCRRPPARPRASGTARSPDPVRRRCGRRTGAAAARRGWSTPGTPRRRG